MKSQIFKTSRIVQAVALSVALFSMSAANATVTDWGVHSEFESAQVTLDTPGIFTDFYTFTLPSVNDVSSVAVSNNLLTFSNIPAGNVSLFLGTYGDANADTLLNSYTFDGTTGSTPHTVAGLSGGSSYYYEVSGNATGSHGGQYQFASSLSPVPEPETYGMLMAGLGLMGFIARRRNNRA
jgi:hypothetical protein